MIEAALSFLTWLLSKLFGGDKTAELAESKGKLEAKNETNQSNVIAINKANKIADSVDNLSPAELHQRLSEWTRPE